MHFWRYNCNVSGIGLKNTPKSNKRQKSTFFEKSIQSFVQTTKVLWNRKSIHRNVETIRYSKRNLGMKVRWSSSSLQQRCQNLFENVKFSFDLISEIFNIQKAPSKITRNGVNFQKENVFAVSHVGRKPEKDPKTKMKIAFSTMIKKTH